MRLVEVGPRRAGGSGTLIGLPTSTRADLAADALRIGAAPTTDCEKDVGDRLV